MPDGSNVAYPLKAILLIRDPFHSLISYQHFLSNHSVLLERSRAERTTFRGPLWEFIVDNQSLLWLDLATDWIEAPQDTLVVSYERLVENPGAQLARMLEFLGVTVSQRRWACVLRHAAGPFQNKKHPVVPDETVYDDSLRRLVWGRIRELDDMLVERGYQGLPLEKYAFYGEA